MSLSRRFHLATLRRWSGAVAAASLLLLLGWTLAGAQAAPSWDDEAVRLDDGSRLWFVELPEAPLVEGGDPVLIHRQQDDFRSAAAAAGLRFQERYAFSELWNGLSIAVDPSSVETLHRMDGSFYPVVALSIPPEDEAVDPALLSALSMTGADVAQNELGLTGAGVKIGLIDTGMDYDHPDLGGDGVQRTNSPVFPTARVLGGWDFVGDDFNGTNKPHPDPYPDDCYGHGTHVAGIIGANGSVRGVAPDISFYVYRVFGCSGSTPADILIQAMEHALDDRVQIVNMSLGTPFEWPDYPSAKAANRLVTRGIVVCASIGNDGSNGLYSGGAPGLGEKVIGIGSVDNTFIHLPAFSVSPDGHRTPYLVGASVPPPPPAPISGTFPLARTSAIAVPNDACQALPPHSLQGKVALVRLGTCGAYQQAIHAQDAGAVAVVLYNSAAGFFTPDLQGDPPVTIPVVGITAGEGMLLRLRIGMGPVSLTWGAVVSQPDPTGGQVSSFSSYGLSPDLALKPDITAPGGFIRSTYPIELGSYQTISGTSMSSPHVAGAVALLLQAHPQTRAQNVRAILMNNADPVSSGLDPVHLEAVHHQGAGLLDIPAAVLATTRVEPEKLSLGQSRGGPVTQLLTIHNDGSQDLVYDLSNEPALGTGPSTFQLTTVAVPAIVAFDRASVWVPAHGVATVSVTVAPGPTQPPQTIYGGYVVIAPEGGRELRVPYAGFCGDYPAMTSLTIGGIFDLPWLAQKNGRVYERRIDGATYTMMGEDFPSFIFHLDHQASIFRMEVFDAASGRSWHRAFERKHMPRSAQEEAAQVMVWDGLTSFGSHQEMVPNGRYVMKISALHALGDETNPADWDVWTSPVMTLARPGEDAITAVAPPPGAVLALEAPEPNPSAGPVSLRFATPRAGPAVLELFDVAGRRLRSWRWPSLAAGEHEVRWDGADERGAQASSGAVLCRLTADGRTLTRMAVRLR